MVRVVRIRRMIDAVNHISGYERLWLRPQSVDSGTIVHVLGIMVNHVSVHLVAAHTVYALRPAPAKVYSAVRHLAYLVVGNNHIAHKSGADAKRSPILVGYVGNLIIYDVQTTANLATVRRIVRLMSLERLGRETSGYDAVSGDVIERAADNVPGTGG